MKLTKIQEYRLLRKYLNEETDTFCVACGINFNRAHFFLCLRCLNKPKEHNILLDIIRNKWHSFIVSNISKFEYTIMLNKLKEEINGIDKRAKI